MMTRPAVFDDPVIRARLARIFRAALLSSDGCPRPDCVDVCPVTGLRKPNGRGVECDQSTPGQSETRGTPTAGPEASPHPYEKDSRAASPLRNEESDFHGRA